MKNHTDSIADSLFQLSQKYVYTNPDSSKNLALKAYGMLNNRDQRFLGAMLSNIIGVSFLIQSDYSNASDYLFKALKIATKLNNPRILAKVHNNIAILNKEVGNYKDALSNYIQAQEYYKITKDNKNRANIFSNMSVLYTELTNYRIAIQYAEKAYGEYIRLNDSVGLNATLNSMGLLYLKLNKTDSAYLCLDKALQIANLTHNDYARCNSLINYAVVYESDGNEQKALITYEECKQIALENNFLQTEAIANLGIASIYYDNGKYSEAKKYSTLTLEFGKANNNNKMLNNALELLTNIHAKTNDYQQAFLYLAELSEQKEILDQQRNLHQIYNLEIEKLNENIKVTRLELQKQELLNSKKDYLIIIISLISFVLIVILVLIISRIRQKQKIKYSQALLKHAEESAKIALDAELSERKRLGHELHDGIGPLLSLAKLNINALWKKDRLKPERKEIIFKNLMDNLNTIISEIKSISQNMAPIILVNKGFEAAMIDMVNRINESGTQTVNLDISGLNGKMNSYTEHALYYSILELVNNSIRHAQCSEISIQIIQNHEDITVMIEDNGQGFDKKLLSTQKGLGFKSIRSRVEGLNGRFFIDTRPGRGTIITIVIPIIKTRNYGKDQDNSH